MAVDTSIYNNLLRPPKSVAEYDAERNAGQLAQRQNRLAEMMLSEKQRGIEQDAAKKQAYQGAFNPETGKMDGKNLRNALGGMGDYEGIQALDQADIAKATAARTEERQRLTDGKAKMELIGQVAGSAKDQASYAQGIQTLAGMGVDVSGMPQQYSPEYVRQAQAQVMTASQQIEQVWKQKGYDLEISKFGYQQKHDTEVLGVQVRGQDKTAASAAAGRAQSASQFAARQEAAVPSAESMLPDNVVASMAQQYLAGDTSVMQNLGRGAQGSANIIKLRGEIARQSSDAGLTGADLAAKNAEYFGTKAGQRSVGTRTASVELATTEASSLIPLARTASADVARSGVLAFGKGQIMFNNQTNDPALRKFAAANNSLVNVYARAISPSGVGTVADKEHAREMLQVAYDDKSYNAVLDQMQLEMEAARQAPAVVRKTFSDAVTGRGGHGKPAPAKPVAMAASSGAFADTEKERRFQEYKARQQ